MKYPWAVPGAKCVSLNGEWFNYLRESDRGPAKGEVCTITDTDTHQGDVYIGIEGYGDSRFLASVFRPVIDQSDDIAMFKAIADRGLAQNGIHVSSPQEEHA